MTNLIRCGDHMLAPGVVVCIHLIEHTAADWLPVARRPGGEGESDWLCPDCLGKFPDVPDEDLRAICIHCVRVLQSGGRVGREASDDDQGPDCRL
jgi:hypothetical protein